MKYIFGQKKEMTEVFDDKGNNIAVTKVYATPHVVIQKKTIDKDGYEAVQIGFGESKKIGTALKGLLKKNTSQGVREIRIDTAHGKRDLPVEIGGSLDVSQFEIGDKVFVRGVTKGKGFQGVVRRHGFKGGPASHGHKYQLRMPGSIGPTGPQEVFKGTKMGGRMGGKSATITNLEIMKVDVKDNSLYIKGAVPGARNGWLEIVSE